MFKVSKALQPDATIVTDHPYYGVLSFSIISKCAVRHLGLTFNWGALLGYCAVTGTVNPSVTIPLYFGSTAWTLLYDTLHTAASTIATEPLLRALLWADKQDDLKVGLKSSALTLGTRITSLLKLLHTFVVALVTKTGDKLTKPALGVFGVCAVTGIGCAGSNAGMPLFDINAIPFHLSLAAFGAHLGWQVMSANLNDASNLAVRFRSNAFVAPIILVGIVSAKLLAPVD